MKVIYNGFDFSTLGELTMTQAREMEGGEQVQRAKVTLRVRVDLFAGSYDQNRALVDSGRTALQLPNALLQWLNNSAGVDYVNQTAVLTGHDLPEEWGEYHQVWNLTFSYYEQTAGGAANNVPLTFQPDNGAALKLDVVTKWQHAATVERYTPLRKLRRETQGRVSVEGQFFGDTTQPLATRRTALAALAAVYSTAMNAAAEGVLSFGGGAVFKGVVRVETWTCALDQLVNAVNYAFTASYTLVPDEANYAMAEITAAEKDNFSGELQLTVAGRIQAATEAQARTKLTNLLTAVLAQRGYDADGQPVSMDTTPATISSATDGDTFTELNFSAAYRKWKPTNQTATFRQTGGRSAAVPFGNVSRWRDHYAAQRFNEQRSERRHATGSVEAAGTWKGDASLTVTARRTQLLAMQRQMKTEVNGADGTLVYGDWSQVVRVEDFQAEINQAETGIDWSLTASYSLFPNEGGYATAEFTVAGRAAVEDGDEFMTFNGRILAPNGALARAKLAALRTTVLTTYGWTVNQRLRADSTLSAVDANGDKTAGVPEGLEAADTSGASFLELNFTEEYRRRQTGALVNSTLSVTNREDVASQTLVTTYAGTVTATGPSAGAAYATALARAQALGANRQAAIDSTTTLRGSTIAQELRQTTLVNALEFVRLSFSYEYQSKLTAGRAFLELTTTTARDTFGVDMETCTGSVLARDAATAQTLYATLVRNLYATRLIHSEQTGTAEQRAQAGASWTATVTKFDFTLVAWTPKAGAAVAFKYSFEVARDFLTLEMRTTVQGSCWAANRAQADLAIAALLFGLNLGASVRSRRAEDRERTVVPAILEAMLKVDFDEEFTGRVTGTSGVREMKLTERVTYSSTRWAVQHLPYNNDGSGGVSLPQPAGVEPGTRTVSGSVTAGTSATALAWALRQRGLLTGDANGNQFPQPPQLETDYELVPGIDGIVRGTASNVRLYRVSFTFAELLPLYPPPA